MNHNIIHKQRFILSKTEADFKNEVSEGLICGCDIAFIVEPNNKDIYTHGIYMLKEIKSDINDLKTITANHEIRITDNETDIANLKISLGNLENRVTVNEGDIANLKIGLTAVQNAITNINKHISEIDSTINNFKQEVNNEFNTINNRIEAITTTAVTMEIVTELPDKSNAKPNVIYLVPSVDPHNNNIYTEYLLLNNQWEIIGTLKAELGLENYVTNTLLGQTLQNYYTKTETNNLLNQKANVSHTHTTNDITNFPTFKTINGLSITGSGNITISAPTVDLSNYYTKTECDNKYLTSHQQIKTINGQSLIGTGDLLITAPDIDLSEYVKANDLKTINGQSLIGSGNITIEGGSGSTVDTYWSLSGNTLSPISSDYEVSAKTFYASSDINLKHNINSISKEDLDKIDNINLVSFMFNGEDVKKYGVIAQTVECAGLNNLVNTTDGIKSVDYQSLMILYIKKLETEIEELKERVNKYEQTNSNKA